MLYRVSWSIDIEAESPLEATREALAIQRDPESIATVFDVTPHAPQSLTQVIDLRVCDCGKSFPPQYRDQTYCSDKCASGESK